MEDRVDGGDAPACHVHAAWPSRLGPTLSGDQGVQGREPHQKRLGAARRMRAPGPGAPVPLEGVLGLRAQGARGWPLRGFEDRLPARRLVLAPAPDAVAGGHPAAVRHGVSPVAAPVTPGQPAPALARWRSGAPGVERRAARLAHGRSARRQWLRPRGERVAPAEAETRPRPPGPPPRRGAVNALGEDPSDPRRRLRLGWRAWARPRGPGQSRRAGRLGVPHRPAHAAPDAGRTVHVLRQTTAVLCLRDDSRGPWEPTPAQPRDPALGAHRTDPARDRQGGERAEARAPLQPEAPRGGPQGLAGHLRAPLARASDDGGEDREHCCARRALHPPEGHSTQADTDSLGVAGPAPAAATGHLGGEWNATGQEKRAPAFDHRLAVAQELDGGRCSGDIDGEGAGVPRPCGGSGPVSPPGHQVTSAEETRGGSHVARARRS
jgi:hypothetical protein